MINDDSFLVNVGLVLYILHKQLVIIYLLQAIFLIAWNPEHKSEALRETFHELVLESQVTSEEKREGEGELRKLREKT